MPKEVIVMRDQNIEVRWNKDDGYIELGVITDSDFVYVHRKKGVTVIDSEPFDSLWANIEYKEDAIRLISAVRSALKHLPDKP